MLRKAFYAGTLIVTILFVSSYKVLKAQNKEYQLLLKRTQQQQSVIEQLKKDKLQAEKQTKQLENRVSELQQKLTSSFTSWSLLKGIATAYSPLDNQSGIEAGADPHKTSIGLAPGPNVIAVDPKKIPYYSEMLVIYPDGHTVRGIAGDTGGALRNANYPLIDIYKRTYKETQQHGRQDVTILWKQRREK